ncbi:MAG: DNA protecting protein DprA [Candidatus Levybacteria bacterium RIFCSPHIGHO2_01_FULL_38_26]|nr:MAG: DNA protecting protein DprA [Candidatus Levybacteria bacterium RIFCSPHIGHO2_01_FULL_38_26]
MSERNYWLGFSAFSGIGPMKFKKLISRFGSAKNAWRATKSDLAKLLGEKLTDKFDDFRNEFSISDYAAKVQSKGVSFLTLKDKEYPKLLSQIKNPPFVLYIRGDVEILRSAQDDIEKRTIAVVGTRKTTQYGREVTRMFTEGLAAAGFTIVSGLAMGVDAVSHKTALENNGKTIAVLGCGVDCCYPRENQGIYNSIVESMGLIVSEYPLSQLPTKGSFPSRNRIIAGLSLGVLVTEGAEDSGALITADYARKFNRPVFAVPGPITSGMSKGPFKLIQKGAKLVTSAYDILKELKVPASVKTSAGKQNSKVGNATKEEWMILEILQNEPLHFDEVVRRSGFGSSKTGTLLSLMEIKGMIKSLDTGFFSIAS